MKLNDLSPILFNNSDDIYIDISCLYSYFGDKEIYDILKDNIYNHGYLLKSTKISYKKNDNTYTEEQISSHYFNFYFTLINTLTDEEKQELLELALTTTDIRFAAILLSNPKVSLTKKQFDHIFYLKDIEKDSITARKYRILKEFLVLNNNIPLTDEQFNQGLLTFDCGLNQIFSKRDAIVPSHIIEILIKNEEPYTEDILINILKRKKTILTQEQIDYCLNGCFLLRLACAENYQLNFTEQQILKGLNDEGFEDNDLVVEGFSNKDFRYNGQEVIFAFLKNLNINIPKKYIELLFNENMDYLISYLLDRKDFCLNDTQLDYVLNLRNELTYKVLKNYILSDTQILELFYTSKYWQNALFENYFNRKNINISENITNILNLKSKTNEE